MPSNRHRGRNNRVAEQTTTRLEGKIALVGADEHPHAARRLRQAMPSLDWFDAETIAVPGGVPAVSLVADASRPEGAFALSVNDSSGTPIIEIVGGPFSGVIYGVEELIQRRAGGSGAGVAVQTGAVEQVPSLPYRAFWTWDHSTNWDLDQIGAQEMGVMHPYAKPPDGFLADYKRMVDFMSRHRIAAVTIYGFFRDSHGGVEAAQELCRYANERGVRILPGVAINAYGGIYWDGDHPYNLATWLRKHPELAADMAHSAEFQIPDLSFPLFFPACDYTARGCSSRTENQAWMEEGIAWLAETCDIGGINIEAGDYGICACSHCARRRAEREETDRRQGYAESWSLADVTDFFPRLSEVARTKRADLWLYAEIQWDNLLDAEAMKPLRGLPDTGIYQHTFNRSYWQRTRRELTSAYIRDLPTRTNVFRCQFANQWNGDRRTERYFFSGRDFAEMAWKAAECGVQGLTVFGEVSPYQTATELSYLAFARFSYDPSLTWDQFLAEDVAPRLGGDAAAARFLAHVATLDQHATLESSTLAAIQAEALDAARHPDDDVARRWLWLAERAARRRFGVASPAQSRYA
jgi:hypothetical protein